MTMMLMMMMMAIGKYGGIWVCLSARLSEVDLDGELCGRRDDHHTHDDDDMIIMMMMMMMMMIIYKIMMMMMYSQINWRVLSSIFDSFI